jgi:glycosyltransferase involved in cell wall biosynthesis
MKIVLDAIPAVAFGGYAVALEATLAAWEQLDSGDEVHILMADGVELDLPESMHVHRFPVGKPAVVRRIAVQSRAARKVCREVGADALLGLLPTTALSDVGCPKVITVYDMRHELLPEQFSRGRRLLRKVSYGLGYRQAAGIICISERTRRDLLRSRPWLNSKPVVTVLWAADHVDHWPRDEALAAEPYALAFGHFPNKAVERVVDAWAILNRRGEARPLVFVGVPRADREAITERIRAAGLDDVVTLLPWLDNDEFRARFTSAGMIVFPSDFEGFGLPAVEALRLEIPLVISDDEALLEVTGGNATVVAETDPESLADAVAKAWATPGAELERGRAYVAERTWADVAADTRMVLAGVADGSAASPAGLDAAGATTGRSR